MCEEGLELRRYGDSVLEIELLLARVHPTLPQGMRVDACIGVAWRVKSSTDISPLSLRAEWEAAPPSSARELLSDGELVAATWDFLDGQASLGVAEEGVRACCIDGCFEIVLVTPDEGRTGESFVSIAWKTRSVKPSDASTWFAADAAHTAMAELLRKGA